jgi:hypothetical protein
LAQFTQKLAKLVEFAPVKHICPKFSQIFGPERQILSKEFTEKERLHQSQLGGALVRPFGWGAGLKCFFMGDFFFFLFST